jgi:hypothetical protein
MIGSWWYEESEKNWDSAVLAEVNATWQYEMLGGKTYEFRHCVFVCSPEQCKVYEFKDIPHLLISGICTGSGVRYSVHTAKPNGLSGGVAALFVNLNTRWRSVVSFTH